MPQTMLFTLGAAGQNNANNLNYSTPQCCPRHDGSTSKINTSNNARRSSLRRTSGTRSSSPIPICSKARERKAKENERRLRLAHNDKESPVAQPPAAYNVNILSAARLDQGSVGSLSTIPYFTGFGQCMDNVPAPTRLSDDYEDYPSPLRDARGNTSLHGIYNNDPVSPLILPKSCHDENDFPSQYERRGSNGSKIEDKDDYRQKPGLVRSLSSSISMNELASSLDSGLTSKGRKCCFLKDEESLFVDDCLHQEDVSRSNLYFALRQFEQDTESKMCDTRKIAPQDI